MKYLFIAHITKDKFSVVIIISKNVNTTIRRSDYTVSFTKRKNKVGKRKKKKEGKRFLLLLYLLLISFTLAII